MIKKIESSMERVRDVLLLWISRVLNTNLLSRISERWGSVRPAETGEGVVSLAVNAIQAGNALNDIGCDLVNDSLAPGFIRHSACRRVRTGIRILRGDSGFEKLLAIGVQDIVDLICGNMHDCLKPILN